MAKGLVVVTGASHGIGHAVAQRFAAEGYPILMIARHADRDEVSGPEADLIMRTAVDVADYGALEAAIHAAEARYGPVECLVNNAGFLKIGAFESRDPAQISYEVDVLLKGVINGTRAVLGGMVGRERGTIINISSIGDRLPGPDGEIYHACKAAIRSLSSSLQKSKAAQNVRIINVAPGLVKTNIHRNMGISFEDYCEKLGHPDFISADELADIVFYCWSLPQRICVRDIAVMPTSSSFG